jgi:hypothetical protein
MVPLMYIREVFLASKDPFRVASPPSKTLNVEPFEVLTTVFAEEFPELPTVNSPYRFITPEFPLKSTRGPVVPDTSNDPSIFRTPLLTVTIPPDIVTVTPGFMVRVPELIVILVNEELLLITYGLLPLLTIRF